MFFTFFTYFWGFILTMWNVNVSSSFFISTNLKCFILTMWNVNNTTGPIVAANNKSFILTMWNAEY